MDMQDYGPEVEEYAQGVEQGKQEPSLPKAIVSPQQLYGERPPLVEKTQPKR